jgi:flagellar hook-basal body complex protein FliE
MNPAISRVDITQTLSKIREISQQTHVFGGKAATLEPQHAVSPFNQVFSMAKSAIADVSQTQQTAQAIQQAYLSGDNKTSVSEVMLATMKSKVAFEGLLVVRNKLLEAYKEIMNMPV